MDNKKLELLLPNENYNYDELIKKAPRIFDCGEIVLFKYNKEDEYCPGIFLNFGDCLKIIPLDSRKERIDFHSCDKVYLVKNGFDYFKNSIETLLIK